MNLLCEGVRFRVDEGGVRFRVDNGVFVLCICFARELGLGLMKGVLCLGLIGLLKIMCVWSAGLELGLLAFV
jgi:hypothetical protein